MLAERKAFHAFLRPLFRKDWVVYAKRPFGGPEHVLHYLARYTHRVAISNHRIVNFADGKVTFRWKDYAHKNKQRLMTVTAEEFLRRFLLHTLPRGFVRIRFCGFLANRRRGELLPVCRQLLQAARCRRTQQHRTLPSPVLPAPGSARIAAEPWSSSKSSLLNRCFGDLWGGRASLTLHSSHSSSNHSLAPARTARSVSRSPPEAPKCNTKLCLGAQRQSPFTPDSPPVKGRPRHHRRLQIRRARGSPGRLNTHSPAASAANAGGFLQTSLSEVTRRSRFRRAPALTRRVTPDRVIAFYSRTHSEALPISKLPPSGLLGSILHFRDQA